VADFHCSGRFPGGTALAASLAGLSPGSKARANPLGVATSISISKSKSEKYSLHHKWYIRVFQRTAKKNQKQLEKNNHFSPTVLI